MNQLIQSQLESNLLNIANTIEQSLDDEMHRYAQTRKYSWTLHRRRLLTARARSTCLSLVCVCVCVSETPRETERLENMGEEDLDRLREQRLAALKKQQKKRQEWMRKGHGEYREVEEKEFFNEMKVGALLAGSDISTGSR